MIPLTRASGSSIRGTKVENPTRRKWCNFMPLLVALVFVAEIAFLGRLDVAKNAALVDSWWSDSVHRFEIGYAVEKESCESWLEREDDVVYSRDFLKDPILVSGANEDSKACSVGCKFGLKVPGRPDAAFGPQVDGIPSIHRSMESSEYYAANKIANARRWVFLLG